MLSLSKVTSEVFVSNSPNITRSIIHAVKMSSLFEQHTCTHSHFHVLTFIHSFSFISCPQLTFCAKLSGPCHSHFFQTQSPILIDSRSFIFSRLLTTLCQAFSTTVCYTHATHPFLLLKSSPLSFSFTTSPIFSLNLTPSRSHTCSFSNFDYLAQTQKISSLSPTHCHPLFPTLALTLSQPSNILSSFSRHGRLWLISVFILPNFVVLFLLVVVVVCLCCFVVVVCDRHNTPSPPHDKVASRASQNNAAEHGPIHLHLRPTHATRTLLLWTGGLDLERRADCPRNPLHGHVRSR